MSKTGSPSDSESTTTLNSIVTASAVATIDGKYVGVVVVVAAVVVVVVVVVVVFSVFSVQHHFHQEYQH